MKIELIGTGSVVCNHLSSCTLIDKKLLIDIGNGIVKKIKQTEHSIIEIENIIITHLHGDHFADLPFFFMDRCRANVEKTVNIYGPKGTENKIKELYDILDFPLEYEKAQEKAKINFIEFKEMKHKEVGKNTYITSFEVEHGNCKPAYGFVIEKDNFKVGISGDSCYCESISKIVEQSDITILDMCFIEEKKGTHMGLKDIIKFTERYPNKKFITTHMEEDARKLAKEKKIENLIIPEDGEIVEL